MKRIVEFHVLDGDAMEMKYIGRVVLENGVITIRDLSENFIRELSDFGGGLSFKLD